MSQALNLPHLDLTQTPVDLRVGLADGSYEVQPRGGNMLIYIGGESAPTDEADYRFVLVNGVLRFRAGGESVAIWGRAQSPAGVALARQRVPHLVPHPPLSRPHFDASTTPADLRGSLPEGNYRAYVPAGADALVFTGESAPTDEADYWRHRANSIFAFCAGPGTQPTWIRTVSGTAVLQIDGG